MSSRVSAVSAGNIEPSVSDAMTIATSVSLTALNACILPGVCQFDRLLRRNVPDRKQVQQFVIVRRRCKYSPSRINVCGFYP